MMLSCRMPLLAPLAAVAALAAGAPAADAAVAPKFTFKPPAALARLQAAALVGYPALPGGGGCANNIGGVDVEGQGRSGGNDIFACGTGLTFIGPATAINTTIGPTIISPGFVGTVITTTGNVAIVP